MNIVLRISIFNETPEPSIIVLQILFPSCIGDAQLMTNVGDLGGVIALLIEQLECLLGTDIVSIVCAVSLLHLKMIIYIYTCSVLSLETYVFFLAC